MYCEQIRSVIMRQSNEVEGVGYRMRKAAKNESRYAEKKRQEFTLSGKLHSGGHNEATAYCQQAASHRTLFEA